MQCTAIQNGTCCPSKMGRRSFLITVGTSAVALDMGLLDSASSLFAAEPESVKKPVVRAVFLRPKAGRQNMGWPGKGYDINASQAEYTRLMADAAKKLDVQLEVKSEPVFNIKAVNGILEKCKQSPPDGVILIAMSLAPLNSWPLAGHFVEKRGNIPTIVFSPMGTSFLNHIQEFPKRPKTFVASTQDVEWLASSVRMLNAIRRMKDTRICVVQGKQTDDVVLDTIGATLHYIPDRRFPEEYKKVQESDEVRAIADYYIKNARKIVEPTKQDILDAVKTYVVCRRIMAAENCQGLAVNCLPMVKHRSVPPPCLAFSRLRDEGIVAACQADWPAAISSRLTHLLTDRPGFMQNICVNTVNSTLMGSHCACATKLDGFDKPPEPFILRTHTESDLGVATQVLWRIGQRITIMKFNNPDWWRKPPSAKSAGSAGPVASSIILGSGRVLRNIDTPPSGGCRTSLEVEVDDVENILNLRMLHHQLFIYGDHTRHFKAYAQLAGINVVHISEKTSEPQ